MKTGRPVEVPEARYKDAPFTLFPSYLGGHNWHPMSYSPQTGLVYIPVLDIPAVYGSRQTSSTTPASPTPAPTGVAGALPDDAGRHATRLARWCKGRLLAWDPVKQQEAWRVEHRGPWNGGMLAPPATWYSRARRTASWWPIAPTPVNKLWDFATQTGVVAPPISFELDGEQYISVNVGWGGAFALVFGEYVQAESMPNVSRVLTFKLGGKASLPEVSWRPAVVFNPPQLKASAETLALGFETYQDVCMGCHGLNAVSGLLIPDLRGSPSCGTKRAGRPWCAVGN